MNYLFRTITAVAFVARICGAPVASAQTQTITPGMCSISGHVQMTSGSPIKGAVVVVEGVRDAAAPTTGYYRLQTDENGGYQVVVPVGIYNVFADAPHYEGQQQRADCSSGADFTLNPGRESQIPINYNECSDPQSNTIASIIKALNAKVDKFGGPSRRVSAIRNLSEDAITAGKCYGTLVFANGGTESGMLLQDSINGVTSWRWVSNHYLAESPDERSAGIYDEMRRSAASNPNQTVACGVGAPEAVYTTNAVCYSILKFVRDYGDVLRPNAGYAILQNCGLMDSAICMEIVRELRTLAGTSRTKSKMTLTERCADDLERKFPGVEKPRYMNACRELVGYFN